MNENKRLKESKVCAGNYKQSVVSAEADGKGKAMTGIKRAGWRWPHFTRVLRQTQQCVHSAGSVKAQNGRSLRVFPEALCLTMITVGRLK